MNFKQCIICFCHKQTEIRKNALVFVVDCITTRDSILLTKLTSLKDSKAYENYLVQFFNALALGLHVTFWHAISCLLKMINLDLNSKSLLLVLKTLFYGEYTMENLL